MKGDIKLENWRASPDKEITRSARRTLTVAVLYRLYTLN